MAKKAETKTKKVVTPKDNGTTMMKKKKGEDVIRTTTTTTKKETKSHAPWDIGKLKLPRDTEIIVAFAWYAFLALCIGFPIWYKTTTIYRAPLPGGLTDLDNYTSTRLRPTLSVIGLCHENSNLASLLQQSLSHYDAPSSVSVTVEEVSGATLEGILTAPSDYAIDKRLQALHTAPKSHHYTIYVIETSSAAKLAQRPVAGQWRHGWTYADGASTTPAALGARLGALASVLMGHGVYAASTAARSAPSYELTFTLLLDEDHSAGARGTALVSWDFGSIAARYLEPLAARLAPLGRVATTSQILHFAGVGGAHIRAEGGAHYIREEALPQLLDSTAGEWKIDSGSAVETAKAVSETLNFVMVVPAPQHAPLHVLPAAKKGAASSTSSGSREGILDAYVRPRWGGAVIKNVALDGDNGSAPIRFGADDVKREMEVFVTQIRELMGISNAHVSSAAGGSVRVLYGGCGGATQWEVDAVVRTRAAENLREARRSLAAFGRVLADARYMRVVDRLGDLVRRSVEALEEYERLAEMGDFDRAFEVSKKVVVDAEEAFFDKDMLALMYFPDEHKYALYVPLFFPLASQIVTSSLGEIKFRIQRYRNNKRKEKNKKKREEKEKMEKMKMDVKEEEVDEEDEDEINGKVKKE